MARAVPSLPSPIMPLYLLLPLALSLSLAACRAEPPDHIEAREPLRYAFDRSTPTFAAPVNQQLAIAWLPACVARHAPLFAAAAAEHRVDAELLAILTLVESGGYTRATSRSGARGLMQIMPTTGRIIADQRRLKDHSTEALYLPGRNIDYGAYYIAEQLGRFRDADRDLTIERAAAAYNGGPTHVRRFLQGEVALAAQTQRYKYWVRGMWDQRRAAHSSRLDEWRAAGGERLLELSRQEMSGAPASSASASVKQPRAVPPEAL